MYNMLNMRKFIFYAVALLSVASLLNGCKKDDGNESKGPNVEGVFWFEEEEDAPGVMIGLYLKDGNISYYGYAKSDEGAATLSVETRKFVKKGNIVLVLPLSAYTIVKNEDGTSGTINTPLGKLEYSGLTENSVFFVSYESEGNEPARMIQYYTLEYLGFPVTGIVE